LAEADRGRGEPPKEKNMTSKTILLVEDNPSDVDLTRRALAKNNVANELIVARDGQEALDYLFGTGTHAGRDISVQPVIVLLDLRLPKVDGLTVLKTIKTDERTRRIPVVMLTTSKEDRDMIAAYDLGVNSYIRKPVDFAEFVLAVNQMGIYWLVVNEAPPPLR
jgi:two-component system, response regulator